MTEDRSGPPRRTVGPAVYVSPAEKARRREVMAAASAKTARHIAELRRLDALAASAEEWLFPKFP